MHSPNHQITITGAILAGGRGTRMGGRDKGLIPLAGGYMVEQVIDRLRPQVSDMLLNANRNETFYADLGLPVVGDDIGDYAGPLAGLAACLRASRHPWVVTCPCDAPLLPTDLAPRLIHAAHEQATDLSVAHDGERLQPLFALVPTRLAQDLAHWLANGNRRTGRWFEHHGAAIADFSDCPEAFLNINTPADQAEAITRLDTRRVLHTQSHAGQPIAEERRP
ncbi:molybdopterin-guanine dinucleotide biosynthesis protein A [Ectothiorhodospira sp. PHS-1]|uniref:molybdenum cofactor guanylyltransferase MobA n=1 Tax=Ectothiorhodospira sp. PHS-1 TaxID=519989 RepID=UPI00024A87EC|nr:molybdenum cofactor guanylyltransferase MobA [Ectothiorhodospira sp. PHS-1]EHQ53576.1 molybdopterin-guanine dinucleotide biosynthesis protein A [Ectothiorhodospira sp. PHS-1]